MNIWKITYLNCGDSSFGRELNWYHRRHGIESRSSQALKSYLLNCVDNCYDLCMSSFFLVCFLKYENVLLLECLLQVKIKFGLK